VSFEQAAIRIERDREFAELRAAIQSAFAVERVEKLLGQLSRKGIRIRDFDGVLASKALESVVEEFRQGSASSLYQLLPVSDQAQIREFYLFRIEEVDPKLRAKFQKLYQYY
jgi:hypothetical protein